MDDSQTSFVAPRWSLAEQWVALVAVFAVGTRVFLVSGLTIGMVVALALLPVWVGSLRRYQGAIALMMFGGLAVASGYVLSEVSASSFRMVASWRLGSLLGLAGVFLSVGVILWARAKLSLAKIGLSYGFGATLSALLSPGMSSVNPWKFALAVPVAMVALALAGTFGRRWMEIVALLGLGGISIAFDSRSYMASFLLTALLVLWQIRPQHWSKRASGARTGAILLVLVAGVYFLARTLLVEGALGLEAQQRSVLQIETAGNLILGGRPELAATLALLTAHPWGYGFGVSLGVHDINIAKGAMAALNYDPNNGYVDRFMFGQGIELHSVVGDLWAGTGVAGLLLVLVMTIIFVRGLVTGIAHGQGSALLLFLGCWSIWNLFFSPFYASSPSLILMLGLACWPRKSAVASSQESEVRAYSR